MTEPSARQVPNPEMQPTGRGGPEFLANATFLVTKQWKR
jgi:hypothetical protein